MYNVHTRIYPYTQQILTRVWDPYICNKKRVFRIIPIYSEITFAQYHV
ncbi:unnamed protein product [Acanthoscelides obtectus]|uniref:Uncharacterized protein n=1 Tax=Acanthoscelides obtectus TaxID=200917 RepID=A0A9P0L2A8_ACAOB|nr:unnamed protein product [Acanthoscelides obtectus]CAK1649471.1 hypothetical protein AOBTE_LOCUS16265 [Acanthoscelides obtectus]